MDLIRQGLAIAQDPKQSKWINPLLILCDAALSFLIVHKISCKPHDQIVCLESQFEPNPYLPTDTEIDWTAYMTQISLYLSGERNYASLIGGTGPLVYPAAHVYIYRLLYNLTSSGTNIRLAQYIFIALYLSTLALVLTCYRSAGAPPWILPLLVLSKRLHSIFMLRLFNDGFAVFFLFAAVAAYQRKWWTVGSLAFTLGSGVKMSLLLALPAVGVVLWLGAGRDRALKQAALMGQVQVSDDRHLDRWQFGCGGN